VRALRRVESALNRAVYAKRCLGRRPETTVSELYLLSDVIERSVTCEAAGIDTGAAGYGDRGEWEVRRALALGIRSLRLPYRLECRFRLNLEAGVAALSFGTVEPDVVAPREWCGDGGPRRTTRARRELRAARLACREAMVLAAMAAAAEAAATAPTGGADIMDINTEKSMELRKTLRQFVQTNPEVAAQMLKTWLRGEEESNG